MTDVKITEVERRFILHWGEMGTRWGVNRTVAQIHALLFLSPKPLDAEAIAATLGVARSNVSNSLRELQGWRIVRVARVLGDRRDHFESLKDIWDMFRIIAEERKKREVDPTLEVLREVAAEARNPKAADAYTRERLEEMLQFFQTISASMEQLRNLPAAALSRMARMAGMGDRLVRLLKG